MSRRSGSTTRRGRTGLLSGRDGWRSRGPSGPTSPPAVARLLARHDVGRSEASHIGDGWADARIFPQVGAGIAFNSRHPDVDRAADVALHGSDLTEVVRALDRLPPRSV